MSGWNAAYTNDYGEYEITFESKDKTKTKAVEKVCCAIMDGLVKSPDDVVIGARPKGKWEQKRDPWNMFLSVCSNCGRSEFLTPPYCAGCGAKMEE